MYKRPWNTHKIQVIDATCGTVKGQREKKIINIRVVGWFVQCTRMFYRKNVYSCILDNNYAENWKLIVKNTVTK